MRLDRLLTLYLFRPIVRLRKPRGLRTPILMYHSISDDSETGHPYYWINTSPALFAQHMQYLADHDYKVIPLSTAVEMIKAQRLGLTQSTQRDNHGDILSGIRERRISDKPRPAGFPSVNSADSSEHASPANGRETMSSRCVVLTFDDGYADFYTHAFPVLQRYGFTATVFLPTDYIGNGRPGLRGKEHLTWQQVRELHAQGVTFGSHTCSHPQLHDLRPEEIEHELSASKQAIETELSRSAASENLQPATCNLQQVSSPQATSQPVNVSTVRVDSFCYPFRFPEQNADFMEGFNETLLGVGYEACASTRVGTINTAEDMLALRRIPVNSGDDTPLLAAKLEGAYDWLQALQAVAKRIRRPASNSAKPQT